jgi:hypothetical protein
MNEYDICLNMIVRFKCPEVKENVFTFQKFFIKLRFPYFIIYVTDFIRNECL